MSKYYIVMFDSSNCTVDEKSLIEKTVDRLYTYYYRNHSLKLFDYTLLVKLADELFSSVLSDVNEAISEEIKKNEDFKNARVGFLYFPINLKDIEWQLKGFENEIKYLESLTS